MVGNNDDEEEPTAKAKPPSSTHIRKMPKRKKKFGTNKKLGGDRKKSKTYTRYSEAIANNEGTTAAAASIPQDAKQVSSKKSTKANLLQQLAYSHRDVTVSKKKNIMLQQQLIGIKQQHSNDILVVEDKLAAKADDCTKLAALAQDRRKEGNMALQMADKKVAAMQDEVKEQQEMAASMVAAAQAQARTTIRAERQVTSHTTSRMDVQHQKELQRQSLSHMSAIEAKDQEIILAKQQSEEYRQEVEASRAELHQLKLQHQQVIDASKITSRTRIQSLRARYIADIEVKKREIERLQNDGGELMGVMYDVVGKLEEHEKVAREATKSEDKSSKLAAQRLEDRNKYRDEWREMKDEIAAKEIEMAEQATTIQEYEGLMKDMTQQYEETINDIMPDMFKKTFVKNDGMYTP